MSTLKFVIDADKIASEFSLFKKEVKRDLENGVKSLAITTNTMAHWLAAQKIKTTNTKYQEALKFQEVAKNVYVVSLDEKMLWREEGFEPRNNREILLSSPKAKVAKDGSRYLSIPFSHDKGPSKTTPSAQTFVDIMKKELKRQGINYKKLELGTDGSPLVGKLHKLNIESPKPSASSSHPALFGLSIYQKSTGNKGKIERSLVTFRTVSDKSSPDKWFHPGVTGAKILDEVQKWAEKTWDNDIMPAILEKYTKKN